MYHEPKYLRSKQTLDIYLQSDESINPVVILVVPTDVGQHMHGPGKKSEQQRGHGAFINSLSQLCLRHASKHRMNVESKWKVCIYFKIVFFEG